MAAGFAAGTLTVRVAGRLELTLLAAFLSCALSTRSLLWGALELHSSTMTLAGSGHGNMSASPAEMRLVDWGPGMGV